MGIERRPGLKYCRVTPNLLKMGLKLEAIEKQALVSPHQTDIALRSDSRSHSD